MASESSPVRRATTGVPLGSHFQTTPATFTGKPTLNLPSTSTTPVFSPDQIRVCSLEAFKTPPMISKIGFQPEGSPSRARRAQPFSLPTEEKFHTARYGYLGITNVEESDPQEGYMVLAYLHSLINRRSKLNAANKIRFYKAIIIPMMTYGSSVWGQAASSLIRQLQALRNKILRMVTYVT